MTCERDSRVGRRVGVLVGLLICLGLLTPVGATAAQLEVGAVEVEVPAAADPVVAPVKPAEQVTVRQTEVPAAVDETAKGVTAPVTAQLEPVVRKVSRMANETTVAVTPVVKRVSDTAISTVSETVSGTVPGAVTRTVERVSAPTTGLVTKSLQAAGPRSAEQATAAGAGAPVDRPSAEPTAFLSVAGVSLTGESVSVAVGGIVADLQSFGSSAVLSVHDELVSSDPIRALLNVVGSAGPAVDSMLAASGSTSGGGIGLATIVLFSLVAAVVACRLPAAGLLRPSAPFVSLSERPG